jgi:chorismate dehydratase
MERVPVSARIRVGAVNYLNTKPLIHGFDTFPPAADLTLDLPSRLADDLAGGRLDVALIPSIEFFHDAAYTVVSNACIACRGPVLSVKLFSRVPPESIRSLALDEGSRASAALARVLLAERYGIDPDLQTLPIGALPFENDADAILLIGDRAIHSPPGRFEAVWDLGDEWCRWSGLPFVFAVWAARAGADLGGIDAKLNHCRDEGVAQLNQIAAREAAPLGLTQPECLSYLRDNLYFYLGPRELRGLGLFQQLAARLGIVPGGLQVELPDWTHIG